MNCAEFTTPGNIFWSRSNSNLQPYLAKNISIYLCVPYHWKMANHETFQYLMETLLGFLIPFTFIVVCYTSVVCRLRSAMFRGRLKGSLLIFLIIMAFAVFWLPYHVINILQVLSAGEDPTNANAHIKLSHKILKFVEYLLYSSTRLNLLIY